MKKDVVLLLGASGQVGTETLARLQGTWQVIAPRSSELDLTDLDATRRMIRSTKPRWIVNAAAYTAVDRAESEPDTAFLLNAEAVRIMGEEARALGAAVIHFSTDYVFDGTARAPRQENDATGPLGVYGSSKLAGERALADTMAAHFIFRTSWVYSTHGKNFLLTILKLARERAELSIVADQIGAPTSARTLAELTQHAMLRSEAMARDEALSLPAAVERIGGLYHASNSGETSWYGFAMEFIELARSMEMEAVVRGSRASHAPHFAKLKPITTAEYPTPAKRPLDSRMECTRLSEKLGFTMPSWKKALRETMEELVREPQYRTTEALAGRD
ncbi:dTDP-4-dehydrorhamnose reductase [Acidipila sp. EB88]|uniref:dTDP-4-dehydrorhamnose reductase n=1 Tax=Acidipila sp. EB88 TaxID=2305226 RepID=UPI000F5E346C|nr:dTDP-4-dehydrorhamnose reductase [Acidipila sp. EB88]RRA49910.1 dTDP-4-dehydrorhamnose reductase [Acidipila sp. EB88]